MKKVRIAGVPKMQTGGYAPISTQERDNWERMQSAAHQQGFYGNEHSNQPGMDFMQKYGIDPSRLPAYQQDFLNLQGANPIKGEGQTRATHGQYSGVDNRYGQFTSGQRYTHYQTDDNGKLTDYGTDFNRFKTNADAINARGNTGWEGFGDPKSDINYRPQASAPAAQAPTGMAATGFPTREEAIAKYKARSGRPLPGNYFAGDASSTGDPIGQVRQTGQDVFRFGGTAGRRRVRIAGVPEANTMAMGGTTYVPGGPGGYGNQQQGHGYALDRFWSSPAGYPGATSQVQPFARIGNTLPEAQDGGDINAEKNERILGDFDQDGSQELMNVNGPSHAEGGKDVNVPSNSFVYSDTKDLKIKDPKVLAQFGMTAKRGGYTPAEIAKKYDLNKYKGAMSNPDADDYATKTAQLMTDNYLEKLSKLAHVQEMMKGHMGMPNSAQGAQQQPMARYGGAPHYQYAGKGPFQEDAPITGSVPGYPSVVLNNDEANDAVSNTVSPVYNMYPNKLTAEGYKHERPTADNMQSFVQQSINPRPQYGTKPVPFIPPTEAGNAQYDAMRRSGWDGKEDPGQWAQRTQPQAVQNAIAASGMKNPAADAVSGNSLGNSIYGPRWQNFTPQGPDWNPTMQNVNGQGDVPALPGATPTPPPISGQSPMQNVNISKKPGATKKDGPRFEADPNFLGNLQGALQIASLRKFQPYEPVPQAVIPDTVFLDPTRAIAAQAEEARSGSEMDAMSGNPQAARAMAAMRQGIAGKQAADTIGQYHNQNVQIANQASREAAAITNQLMEKQATRLADLNKGNFLSDREYQKQLKNLQEEQTYRYQQQHNAEVNRLRYNKWNPYFEMDRAGYYQLKPGVTEAKLQDIYSGKAGSGSGDFAGKAALAKQYKDELIKQGFSETEAEKIASGNAGLREHERMTTNAYGVPSRFTVSGLTPGQGMYGNSYMGGYGAGSPMMNPTDNYSGNRIGGEVKKRPLMRNGGPTDLLKRTALKKFMK